MAALRVQLSASRTLPSTILRSSIRGPTIQSIGLAKLSASEPLLFRSALRPFPQCRTLPSSSRNFSISSLFSQYRSAPRSPRVSRGRSPSAPKNEIPYNPPEPEINDAPPPPKGWDVGKVLQRSFLAIFLSIFTAFNYDKVQMIIGTVKETRQDPKKFKNMTEEQRKAHALEVAKAGATGPWTTWMYQHFTYSVAKVFPPADDSILPQSLLNLVTYNFSHSSPMHLIFCYISLGVFLPDMAKAFGPGRTTALFLAGGTMAGLIHCYFEKFTNPLSKYDPRPGANNPPQLIESINAMEPAVAQKYAKEFYGNGLGSSSAIIALGTLYCIISPALEVSIMFLPIGIPIRLMIAGLASFDAYGYFIKDPGLGIGHGGHLAGNVAGLILYATLFRGGKMYEGVRRLQYYTTGRMM